MEKHLTTIENIRTNTRFVSKYLDDSRIDPYIEESEQINIKHQIGESLFIDLLDYVKSDDKDSFPDYSKLLDGSTYTDSCGLKRSFLGLVECLNYYVWARIVKNNNYTVTRFGTVNKTDNYSQNAELKERLVLEKDALSIADKYLSECIDFLNANKTAYPLYKRGKQVSRYNIKIVG